jgi:alpha/beta superfamily hydrolase
MAAPIVPQVPVRFATDDGVALEGEIRRPIEVPARGTAVVCHPHPKEGGSKDHPLLWALRSELSRRGLVVLSFNFRGVMGSSGTYGGGHAETRDAVAAIDRVREEQPGPALLAGWSFGANVALRVAIDERRVAALALVGIPLGEREARLPALPDPGALRALSVPVLLLAGENDDICPAPSLEALGVRFARSRVEIVPGSDHYFRHREADAASIVANFAEGALFGSRATGGRGREP